MPEDNWNGPTIREYSDHEIDFLKGHYFLMGFLVASGICLVLWWGFH